MAKIEKINEKAKSKSQQRLFGMVTAYKDGKLKLKDLPDSLAKKIKSIADGERKKTGDKRKKTKGISKSDAKDFAKTKHEGLPEKVSENKILNFENFINESIFDKKYKIILFDNDNKNELTIFFDDKGIITNIKNDIDLDVPFNIGEELHYYEFVKFVNKLSDNIYINSNTRKNLIKLAEINVKNKKLHESKDEKDSYGSVVVGDKPEHYMDALKGGEADGMTLEDIAKLHEVPIEYLQSIMDQAIEIEYEHTKDRDVAERIALDHLTESPLYYDDKIGLPNMEEELEDMDDEEVEEVIDDRLKNNIKKFDDFEE